MQKKILIIEDEAKILEMIKTFLTSEGYKVLTALDGDEGLNIFLRIEEPDLIILDWMMPGKSGLDVLKEIRQTSQVPIIMLTAKVEEIDKLIGLEIGADDYITKPFSLRELGARIKVQFRRITRTTTNKNILTIGELKIDIDAYKVWVKDKEILGLTPTEFKLLAFLMSHPGKVFTRIQLLDLALGDAYEGYERSLDTHISNLRKKIEIAEEIPRYINTIYGVGYKFSPRG